MRANLGTQLSRAALSLSVLLATVQGHAVDVVWTNTAGGFWNAAVNWNPNRVPIASDRAWITNSGTYTVTNNASAGISGALTLGALSGVQTLKVLGGTFTLNGGGSGNTNAVFQLEGGTVDGVGTLALAGPLNWTGGSITRLVECAGGTLNTSSILSLDGGRLVNSGVLTLAGGGALRMGNGAVISNLAGATFDMTANFGVDSSGFPTIVNEGLFRKSGDGAAYVAALMTNTGTLLVESGTLELRDKLLSYGGTNVVLHPGILTFGVGSGFSELDTNSLLSGDGAVICNWGPVTVNGVSALTGSLLVNSGVMNFSGSTTIGGLTVVSNGAMNFKKSATVGSLTLNGWGAFGGTGTVTVNGPFLCLSGTITGAVECAGGTLAGGTLNGYGGRLLNSGLLVVSNIFGIGRGSILSNLPNATIELVGDGMLIRYGGEAGLLRNAGWLRKSIGSDRFQVVVPFENEGAIQVQSGTLSFLLSGTNSGVMSVSSGAVLNFGVDTTAQRYRLMTGSSVTGEGTVVCDHALATVEVDGDFAITGTNLIKSGIMNFNATASVGSLVFSNGVLGGTGIVIASGPLKWTGGTIAGAVQCAGGSIASTTPRYLTGGRLINTGLLTVTGYSSLATGFGSVISNLTGATFDVTTGVSIGNSGTNGVIYNAGLFRTAGSAYLTARVYDVFHNTGTVLARQGVLDLCRAGGNSGVNTATAPGTLSFSGTHFLGAGSSLKGSGTVVCNGNLTVNGDCTMTGTNVLAGGTIAFNTPATFGSLVVTGSSVRLGGTGLVTVTGPLTWNGGAITGSVQCAGGTIRGSAVNNPYLDGGRLMNLGVLEFTGGTLYTGSKSVISNLFGATFDLTWKSGSGSAPPPNIVPLAPTNQGSFYNAGLLRASTGGAIADAFHNSGTVQCSNGTLAFTGPLPAVQSSGSIQLLGGKLRTYSGLVLNGGSLIGTNALIGGLTNKAKLSPGTSVGVLTVASNYTELPEAVLEVELGGLDPGSGFDQLVVTGAVTLAGTLNVSSINGFTPPPNSTFPILTAGSVTGTFAATNLPGGSFGLGLEYAPTGVVLRVLNTPPVITPVADQTIPAGQTFALQLAATDLDHPSQSLTWTRVSGPDGLTVSPAGELIWTPFESDVLSTNVVVVRATDDGLPENLGDTATFSLIVSEPVAPAMAVALTATNTVVISWPLPGAGWRLHTSTNLSAQPPSWVEIAPPYSTNSSLSWWIDAVQPGERFYRLSK